MARARLNTAAIVDFDSFHEESRRVFGFPDFYGRNMNAWIDCLTYLYDGDGMSRFTLRQGEVLRIEVVSAGRWRRDSPETLDALVDCTAFVNQRYVAAGQAPPLHLVICAEGAQARVP